VISSCWIISRKHLNQLGGFGAVSHTVIPEGYFARELVKTDDYSFMRADSILDITSRKKLHEQFATAVRTRYPQIKRRPENQLLLTFILVTEMMLPFFIIVYGLLNHNLLIVVLSSITCISLIMTHILIVRITNPINTFVAAFNFPIAVIIELIIEYMSMYRYEFSEVDWKGRNVCVPVMHTIPRLPPLKD